MAELALGGELEPMVVDRMEPGSGLSEQSLGIHEPAREARHAAADLGEVVECGAALESGVPTLVALLDEAPAAREAGRAREPELATPRPDGPLAGLQPLVVVG